MGSRILRSMNLADPKQGYEAKERDNGDIELRLTNEPGKGKFFVLSAGIVAFKEYETAPAPAKAAK